MKFDFYKRLEAPNYDAAFSKGFYNTIRDILDKMSILNMKYDQRISIIKKIRSGEEYQIYRKHANQIRISVKSKLVSFLLVHEMDYHLLWCADLIRLIKK